MGNTSAEALWTAFKKEHPGGPETYEAWAFGDSKEMADDLARLVIEGIKTATASNYALYEIEKEPIPEPGLLNIILDGDETAVAIIETTKVQVLPFKDVTEEHAYLEGEGDRTLAYWRSVHKPFFKEEMNAVNREFQDDMLVVCEEFRIVYQA